MEVLHSRCAGLDVHRDTVVACARVARNRAVEHHLETFGTTTSELERLSCWLTGHAITHVAMEATGVYWKPVWAVLAEEFELVLANAMHVKNVPGRKTDTNDATWLADLLAHGLIRSSFVPPMAIQALRDLTRTRKQLTREKVSHVERIDKTLQAANIKLGSVLSDIIGASGRAILDALAAGESDPERLADPEPRGDAAAIEREPDQAPSAEVTAAMRARLRNVGHGNCLEADPGVQALHESVALGQRQQGVNDAPVHQPKVASPLRHLEAISGVDQPIEPARAYALEPALGAAVLPDRVGHIGTLLPVLDEGGYQRRRVLQIGVQHDNDIACCCLEPCRQGRLLAEVA